MNSIRLFLVISDLLLSIQTSLPITIEPMQPEPILHAMGNIFDRFYRHQTSNVFIAVESSSSTNKNLKPIEWAGELLKFESNRLQLSFVIENHITINLQKTFNIFVVDSYESFRRIFSRMSSNAYNYAGFYVIVLTEYSSNETITKIFQDCWTLYIANIDVLVPTADAETVHLYTYFPYTPHHCFNSVAVVYDTFHIDAFARNVTIFPNKFRNLYKCPMRLSSFTYPPFVILNESNGTYSAEGIGGRLFQLLAEQLNFTPIVYLSGLNSGGVSSNEAERRQKLRPSLELVTDGTANVSMGSLGPALKRINKFSMSSAYYFGSMIYAIPAGRPYSSLEKLFFPFGVMIWLCICILLIIGAIVMIVLKFVPEEKRDFIIGKANDAPYFNMINILLDQCLHRMPQRNFARTLLLIWIVSSFILRNAYQGKLFDHIRSSQRQDPMFYFDEIMDSNVDIYVLYPADIENLKETDPTILHRFKTYDARMENLYNLTNDHFNGVYTAISEIVDYFNLLNYPNLNILKSKQKIAFASFCMYFRKNSPLTKTFNEQIGLCHSNGLVSSWARRYITITPTIHQLSTEPKKLAFNQISGLLTIYMWMTAASVFVFILEMMSTRCEVIKNILDFFAFTESQRQRFHRF